MNNIKEYLKSDKNDIKLYHKNGELALSYYEKSIGYWHEYTYDSNGNNLTFKNSAGDWYEYTYDSNCNMLKFKDSYGYWCEAKYDKNGNRLTYKNSRGSSEGFDIEEMTMEEVCKALGKTIKIKK